MYRILVVDDEAKIRQIIKNMLISKDIPLQKPKTACRLLSFAEILSLT